MRRNRGLDVQTNFSNFYDVDCLISPMTFIYVLTLLCSSILTSNSLIMQRTQVSMRISLLFIYISILFP